MLNFCQNWEVAKFNLKELALFKALCDMMEKYLNLQ